VSDKIEVLKKEFESLVYQGSLLAAAMALELNVLGDESKKQIEEQEITLPDFREEYENWYSESLRVIKQIVPERLDDFVKQYKNDRRKSLNYETYTIYDYLLRMEVTRSTGSGISRETIVSSASAMPKMQNQVSIVKSIRRRFVSSLFDIKEVLQSDIFDSELEAARELCKKGFCRASGSVSGVVLESHLSHVCTHHKLRIIKKRPTIGDLNELLKNDEVIDTAKWRFISHLADLRNLCDHKREREPNKDDANDLIEGVEKVIKTVF